MRRSSLSVTLLLLVGYAGLHMWTPPAGPAAGTEAVSTPSVVAATLAQTLDGRSSDRPTLSARHSLDPVLSRRDQAPPLDTVAASLLVTLLVAVFASAVLGSGRNAQRHEILSRGPPALVRSI